MLPQREGKPQTANLAQSSCKYRTVVEDKQTIVINWEKETLGPVSLLPQGTVRGGGPEGGESPFNIIAPASLLAHWAPLDTSPDLRQSEPRPPPGTPTSVPGHPEGS